MKKRTTHLKTIFILLSFYGIGSIFSQDVHFSQINNISTLINPANAGNFTGDVRASLNYRNQWSSLGSAFKTYMFSFDAKVKEMGSGILSLGVTAYTDDNVGIMKNSNIKLNIGYQLEINSQNYFSAGIGLGVNQYTLNTTGFQWGTQYDGSGYNSGLPIDGGVNTAQYTKNSFESSVGLNWFFTDKSNSFFSNEGVKVNFGVSAVHLPRPSYSLVDNSLKQNIRFIIYGNSKIGIKNTKLSIVPSALFQISGPSKEIIVGSFVRYMLQEPSKYTGAISGMSVSIGLHSRFRDAIIPGVMFEMGSLAIGVSYDYTSSKLNSFSNGRGGYEITLKYVNPNPFLGNAITNPRFF